MKSQDLEKSLRRRYQQNQAAMDYLTGEDPTSQVEQVDNTHSESSEAYRGVSGEGCQPIGANSPGCDSEKMTEDDLSRFGRLCQLCKELDDDKITSLFKDKSFNAALLSRL